MTLIMSAFLCVSQNNQYFHSTDGRFPLRKCLTDEDGELKATQARGIESPVFVDLEPALVPIDGRMQLRWRCCCLLQLEKFDWKHTNTEVNDDFPLFQSKKAIVTLLV